MLSYPSEAVLHPTVTTTLLVVLSVWASLQTHLLQLQCLLSCPSEPVLHPTVTTTVLVGLSVWTILTPNCYNYSACWPVRLSQFCTQLLYRQCLLPCPSEPVLHPTVTTIVIVVLSIWTSPTPNCYKYSNCRPVRLNKSNTQLLQLQHFLSCPSELVLHPTVTTTVLVVLSVWASLQTQLLQRQSLLSCPPEPVFQPNCYNYSDCCPLHLSQSSNPTVTTTVLVLLSVWATLQTQSLQLQSLLPCPPEASLQT